LPVTGNPFFIDEITLKFNAALIPIQQHLPLVFAFLFYTLPFNPKNSAVR